MICCCPHRPQNLFLTGSDVATMGLAGQLQGGWAAANAALGASCALLWPRDLSLPPCLASGYTVQELTCPDSKRNVVADLDRQRQADKR